MSHSLQIPPFTLHDYETRFADRHRLHDLLVKWSQERPQAAALIAAETGRTLNWQQFERTTLRLAARLLELGLGKGDFLVSLLPMSVDHVLLEFACFRMGVILAPLDLRLTAPEAIRAVELLRPRALVALGQVGPMDFRPLVRAVQENASSLRHLLVVGESEGLAGALSLPQLIAEAEGPTELAVEALAAVEQVSQAITPDDGALVIFTTGSTGSPRPALLSHRNISVQCMCLSGAFFGGDSGRRTLVNLPASHVGGQTEALMATLFGGGSVVLLEIFDAARSLRAISTHQAEILGQIPAMFSLEWMLKEYASHDLSSLKFAAYGGNAVPRSFLEKMAAMAPVVGTGLGLTETAGFCTYVQADAEEHEEILLGLGVDQPIYPFTIRQPMQPDGSAGAEVPAGEIGHVCFRGPQTFLGYVNDPEATARTISSDGWLYTGDLGRRDGHGLHLTGRDKWVIKTMGYQVFPGDVERHMSALTEKVANCVVVGVAHAVVSEAPVAVVEKRPGVELTIPELDRHARQLTSYMRPRHWIVMEPGTLPLNRVVKPDVQRIQQMAREEVDRLRAKGEWDSGYAAENQDAVSQRGK